MESVSGVPAGKDAVTAERDELDDLLDRFERTLETQVSLINETDDKAANVVKYTAVLLGAIFTGLSVLIQSSTVTLDTIRWLPRVTFVTGVSGLLVALCAATITYLSSVQEYGPDPWFGFNVAEGDIQSPEYEEILLNGYATAVHRNQKVIDTNARRFRWSPAALLVGIVYTALAGGLTVLTVPAIVEVTVVVIVTSLVIFVVYLIKEEEFLVLERKTLNEAE